MIRFVLVISTALVLSSCFVVVQKGGSGGGGGGGNVKRAPAGDDVEREFAHLGSSGDTQTYFDQQKGKRDIAMGLCIGALKLAGPGEEKIGWGKGNTVLHGDVEIAGNNWTLDKMTITGKLKIRGDDNNLAGCEVWGEIDASGKNNLTPASGRTSFPGKKKEEPPATDPETSSQPKTKPQPKPKTTPKPTTPKPKATTTGKPKLNPDGTRTYPNPNKQFSHLPRVKQSIKYFKNHGNKPTIERGWYHCSAKFEGPGKTKKGAGIGETVVYFDLVIKGSGWNIQNLTVINNLKIHGDKNVVRNCQIRGRVQIVGNNNDLSGCELGKPRKTIDRGKYNRVPKN